LNGSNQYFDIHVLIISISALHVVIQLQCVPICGRCAHIAPTLEVTQQSSFERQIKVIDEFLVNNSSLIILFSAVVGANLPYN
jgi:hypothetical protein